MSLIPRWLRFPTAKSANVGSISNGGEGRALEPEELVPDGMSTPEWDRVLFLHTGWTSRYDGTASLFHPYEPERGLRISVAVEAIQEVSQEAGIEHGSSSVRCAYIRRPIAANDGPPSHELELRRSRAVQRRQLPATIAITQGTVTCVTSHANGAETRTSA